jgi:hypothetical protein
MSQAAQKGNGAWRDVHIREQLHAIAEVRSLASQAPYLTAW